MSSRRCAFTGKSARMVIGDKGFVQMFDEKEIWAFVQELLQENAGQVDKYVQGKE